MNKKIIIAIFLAVAIIAGIIYAVNTNIANNENNSSEEAKENTLGSTNAIEERKSTESIEEDKNPHTGNQVLIAYFSRADENYNVGTVDTGNTEIMARHIKEFFGDNADTFKIEPVKAYPTGYKECTEVATEEKNSNSRPEIKGKVSNFEQYDIVFVGYPIWWGDVPMIINTFLESYDFKGKTIIPFNTHEGSGDSGTYKYIKEKMSSSDVNTNGLAIRGADARKESGKSTVLNWINELGF